MFTQRLAGNQFVRNLAGNRFVRMALAGSGLGTVLAFAAPPSSAVADPGCTCTMPAAGSSQCAANSNTASSCETGNFKCNVSCPE